MLSGCLESNPETYQYEDGSTFKLFNDGTFIIHFTENNKTFSGNYKENSGYLYLNYPIGYTETFLKIESSIWVDKDGWRWERVSN